MKSRSLRKLSLIVACAGLLPWPAHAGELSAGMQDGIHYSSSSGNFKVKIGASLHLDTAAFEEDQTPLENDFIVRRATLSLRADVLRDWRFALQYDAIDDEERFRSLWLRYRGFESSDITLGQFREPFGLDNATSSNHHSFMERSLATALMPGTNVGIGLHRWGTHWAMKSGFFWETYIGDADPFAAKEGYGVSGQLTFAPIDRSDQVLHLGMSSSYRVPSEDKQVRFRSQPESEIAEVYLVNTGRMNDVESIFTGGLEAALMLGPVTLQSEYVQTHVKRDATRSDERFAGGYLSASLLLKNTPRRYSSQYGAFGAINLKNDSVWELALRRSFLDLNSQIGNITGGMQTNVTWAINWYANENLRFMFNYIRVDTDNEAGDDDPAIFQLRAQWSI
jgi:phosphate-selective porin OprO/OprP